MIHLFTTLLYQPFFNLLIAFYILIAQIPGLEPDMGLAVILLTLVIRILMLPLTIASTRTIKERYEIEQAIKKIQEESHTKPNQFRKQIRSVLRANRRVIISEGLTFLIQLGIFFILYRIFKTGLKGTDIHLMYDFLPPVKLPFNLYFVDTIDLTKPSWILNTVQTITIFAVELVSLANSPVPVNRNDIVRYLVAMPIASFIIFAFLPSGKKLFIITTLTFSLFFMLGTILSRFLSSFGRTVDIQTEASVKAAAISMSSSAPPEQPADEKQ